jgi:YD repeat-containing protein
MIGTSLLVSLLVVGCGRKQANYYRWLTVNSRHEFVGRYPIEDYAARNVKCYHFIYDENGKTKKIVFQEDGKPRTDDAFGVAQILIEYSEGFKKSLFKDAMGKMTPMSINGDYSIRFKLDNNGYVKSQFNYDSSGQLSEDISGVVQYDFSLDGEGQDTVVTSFRKNGDQIPIWTHKRNDENGDVIEEYSCGKNGQLWADNQGIAITRWKYDNYGNQLEESYYGIDNQLKENAQGIAICKSKCDENGNQIEKSFYGRDEQLCDNVSGDAILRWKYDPYGNLIEESFYGRDEQFCDNNHLDWELSTNQIGVKPYGSDGNILTQGKGGIAMVRYKYDQYGDVVGISAYGKDGQLKEDYNLLSIFNGVAMIRMKYDQNGKRTDMKFYRADGSEK